MIVIINLEPKKDKDGLQCKALLEAKKLICGDEWNKKGSTSSPKFLLFLGKLDLIKPDGRPKANVNYLLDFAGYK